MKSKLPEKIIAVADCETDPFRKGYPVHPFVWGFYDGSQYQHFWGSDCNEQFLAFLNDYDTPLTLYAHNGGKFDWIFLSKHFRGNIRVIGSRVVQAYVGRHEIRDSFANIPVPLRDFLGIDGNKKQEINYDIMLSSARDLAANKRKILSYLKDDCLVLYDGIQRYRQMFGNSLTMASASMKQLNKVCTGREHDTIYERLTPRQDFNLRKYYFGGRVQCFKSGIIRGNISMYDVTSMYPFTMKEYMHPISASFVEEHGNACEITDETDFIEITADCQGALPMRGKSGLNFPHGRNTFFATGPEVRTALMLGLLKIHHIHKTITATERLSFGSFVSSFFSLRQEAKVKNDVMLVLFYKLVLNSAYGKFAQNPLEYEQLTALQPGEKPDGELFDDPEIRSIRFHETKEGYPCDCDQCFRKRNAWCPVTETDGLSVWGRAAPNAKQSFLNVATAASITGFSRSVLMKGLENASDPIYCDTDCVVTLGSFAGNVGSNLGEWKHECSGDKIAVAGKKMYALYSGDKVVKMASKGVKISAEDICRVAQGAEITYTQDAPIFKMNGEQLRLVRRIHNTAKVEATDHV